MPRDVNGNYTLPSGNPVTSGTVITSTWANDTMSDIENEITDSLSRSGKGGLTGPLGIIDSSGGVPGLSFSAEPTSGLKREGGGDVRMQVQGTDKQRWRSGVSQRPEVDDGGAWKSVAVEESGQKILRGAAGTTVLWFYNTTVPPGWTLKVLDTFLRNLCVSSGGATPVDPGAVGGVDFPDNMNKDISHTPTGTVGPGGAHTPTGATGNPVGAQYATDPGNVGPGGNHTHTTVMDPVPAHSDHAFIGDLITDNVIFNPRRAQGILGTLDA